ncbi:patatin-like phospholipase family protein [Aquimarina sp. 2201CG14-23]|uniref:patatin-like phospholipase family protein n=1 Tax=Aquimarina mycalae TaxID=3040073 RepID=UPI002477D83F|nr:patatin-like phospholipase family protein [Aquimarina sp. 2201CG14-23]MDH7446170.1 patatin-like phospholipase family protein [Aquimarina sp. 2201CG14-23]
MHATSNNILSLLLFIGIFFAYNVSWSQEREILEINDLPEDEDVKVGLVLSGGGAKGLAHIGALKIIEEAGIRIDYIGGTSMGAIVGSLYASGYTAKELDSIFRSVDFDVLIQDDLPRKAKTFYEREDSEKYALTLPFDDFTIGLPQGLSKGQNFFNQFARLTSHVHDVNDFSKLPIPFFCISTNIATGEQILLDKGYLPEAVSASGALPSIFSPIELDGILMTDGGVANNYPIQEIRKKGAEIVIGIDVQDSLLPKDQLNSVTNIMLQISNFRTIKAMKSKMPETDIYIKPSISDFSLISFDQADKIIANGEKAAFASYEKLRAIKRRQKTAPSKAKVPRVSDTLHINSLVISGNERYTRSYIKGKLKLKTPKTTTYKKLYEGINNLSATGNFDRISHRLVDNELGKELVLNVKESKNTMLLRFALHYDDLYKTAALVNFTKKSLLFHNDVLSFDIALGDNIRYDFDYYIDKGYYWSIGVKNSFNRFNRNVEYDLVREDFSLPDIEVNKINLDFLDLKTQFYLETLLNQTFSFGIGAEYRRFRLISETIGEDEDQLPRFVFDNSNYWSAFGYLRFDSYNNKYFPSSGFLFEGDTNYYIFDSNPNSEDSNFVVAKANFGYAFKVFDKTAVNLELSAGGKFGEENIRSLNFFVGGFGAKTINNNIPFYGYDFLSIVGDSFAKAAITVDYEIFSKNHINVSANYANVGNKLFNSGEWLESPEYSGYALGYGLETFAGPVQIKYSYSPELEEGEWFFSIGFWF